MMSLWAPNATLTVGPGETAAGMERSASSSSTNPACSKPRPTGSLTTPRTRSRSRSTATGVRCISSATTSTTTTDDVEVATTADLDVARIDGQWLIANMVAGSTSCALSHVGQQVAKHGRAAVGETRRPWSPGTIRRPSRGRVPAKVHTKLLIAFVGTSVLLVAVGLLGLRVLGQSNDRVGTLEALQQRALAYGQLQQDAANVRGSSRRTRHRTTTRSGPKRSSGATPWEGPRVDRAVADFAERIAPSRPASTDWGSRPRRWTSHPSLDQTDVQADPAIDAAARQARQVGSAQRDRGGPPSASRGARERPLSGGRISRERDVGADRRVDRSKRRS